MGEARLGSDASLIGSLDSGRFFNDFQPGNEDLR